MIFEKAPPGSAYDICPGEGIIELFLSNPRQADGGTEKMCYKILKFYIYL